MRNCRFAKILLLAVACVLIFRLNFSDVRAQEIGDGETDGIPPVNASDLQFILKYYGTAFNLLPSPGINQYGDSKVNVLDFIISLKSLSLNATPTSANILILCDKETYDGKQTPFKLDGGIMEDSSTMKVIRDCTFKNATTRQIVLKNAKNVLIENNKFINIRTNEPGIGAHAISVSPDQAGIVESVTVRGNYFTEIGADGIQLGEGTGSNISSFFIENNTFIGNESWGENAIDVKGTLGPIVIKENDISGFRECQSPPRGGNQDCSGSPGEGMVIHQASSGTANNVTIEANKVHDNIFGISISNLGQNSVIVRNNQIYDNQYGSGVGLNVRNSQNGQFLGNQYYNNKQDCSGINPCQ